MVFSLKINALLFDNKFNIIYALLQLKLYIMYLYIYNMYIVYITFINTHLFDNILYIIRYNIIF